MAGNHYVLEVKPVLPKALTELTTLANDLLYSWRADIRALFIDMDKALWESCGHRPKLFLLTVSQQRLNQAADDSAYLARYQRVVKDYQNYCQNPPDIAPPLASSRSVDTVAENAEQTETEGNKLVAYFCSEFGLHESLPIYSGGLGILAGDHCKTASDMALPFVAVGLLYHQGYFTQMIGANGEQIATNINHYFGHLPITLVTDGDGNEIHTAVQLPGRELTLRIWRVLVGRVNIYLLDSDVSSNSQEDRNITRQLYGDGHDTRIKQEIVLGIGGVRALRKIDLEPQVWHFNEGHAAFQILERCREIVKQDIAFDIALELVAGSTVFTTHTPVAAGHDSFDQVTMLDYFSEFAQLLTIDFDTFMSLGNSLSDSQRFNMTTFALRGSRFHNGVSKIHAGVASEMEQHIWPQIPPSENPLIGITNGVHVPSILAKKWSDVFDQRFPNWQSHLGHDEFWQCLQEISDRDYWETHQALKATLFGDLCSRLNRQNARNDSSRVFREASVCQLQSVSSDILVLGFARRFATYKRATLIFADRERLSALLNDPKRPVMLVFAGKAHPSDEPGQQLLREIHELSEHPDFLGKVILVEGYDLGLARHLFSGSDVWLNTPIYPLEACGTSGQKAGINGVVNLSVLDGWWAESYDGENGWAIAPHTDKYGEEYRDRQEASDLLNIIEHEIIPAYFERNEDGLPKAWLKKSRAAMRSTITQFSSQRMLEDYIEKLYIPARNQQMLLSHNNLDGAQSLSAWKRKIRQRMSGVKIRFVDKAAGSVDYGQTWAVRVAAHLNGLDPQDLVVELVEENGAGSSEPHTQQTHRFRLEDSAGDETEESVYTLQITPALAGTIRYQIRAYPNHKLLAHPFETGCMVWL